MDINFNKFGFVQQILDGSGLADAEMKALRKDILRKSPAEVIQICADAGITIVDVTPVENSVQINTIKKEFAALVSETGVETIPGIFMKCDFDDAIIVRESAQFKSDAGLTTMTLKDVNGDIHKDIAIADVLATVVPAMAERYAYLWETKENMIEVLKNVANQQEVNDFVITW